MTRKDSRRFHRTIRPDEKLRAILDREGWTQQEFADKLGAGRLTVNQLVNGRRRITPRMALKLAAVFPDTAESWLRLQNAADLAAEQRKSR